jgi:hypothetical protein
VIGSIYLVTILLPKLPPFCDNATLILHYGSGITAVILLFSTKLGTIEQLHHLNIVVIVRNVLTGHKVYCTIIAICLIQYSNAAMFMYSY